MFLCKKHLTICCFCTMFYGVKQQRSVLMAEQNKNYNLTIVQDYLERLGKKNDEGTQFYNDVTILSGPGMSEYNYLQNTHKDLFERWKKGEVSMYNVKWAGVAFVLEYQYGGEKIYEYKGDRCKAPVWNPWRAFVVYKHQITPVGLDLAVAVKNLFKEQVR